MADANWKNGEIKPFKGFVTDPFLMSDTQLEKYCEWCRDYLEWATRADGRVSAYDRMTETATPYFDELEARKKEQDEMAKKKAAPKKKASAKKSAPKKAAAKKVSAKKAAPKKVAAKPKSAKRISPINIKMPDESTIAKLRAQAKKHAGGNLSAWLRHAGLKYVPKAGEKIASV